MIARTHQPRRTTKRRRREQSRPTNFDLFSLQNKSITFYANVKNFLQINADSFVSPFYHWWYRSITVSNNACLNERKKMETTTNIAKQSEGLKVAKVLEFNDKEKQCLQLARDAYDAGKYFADKFRTFAIYARKNVEPKRVTLVLLEAGFSPNRVSDIKAVCMAPDEIFKKYQSKEIGFKPMLEAGREARKAKGEKRGRSRNTTFSNSSGKLLALLNKMKTNDVNYLEGLNLGLVVFPLQVTTKQFKSSNGFTTTVTVEKNV